MSSQAIPTDTIECEGSSSGRRVHGNSKDELRPPGALNVFLGLVIMAGLVALLWYSARQTSILALMGLGVAFGFLGLPLYTLMHECFHRTFTVNRRVNEAFGLLLSAFFPGPFTFMRCCHLGHHRRNRTDAEMFDSYYPGENVFRKRIFFYSMYLGVFWITVPLSLVILLIAPRLLMSQIIQDAPSVAAFANGVPKRHILRIRVEALLVILFQAGLFLALGLTLTSYLTLYASYALSWSSQNYIAHAFSPRHVLNGAFNLKANPVYSAFLLNFNWHLAHHQHPSVPWLHLPKFNDTARERPGYLMSFIRFWKGPLPCTEPPPGASGEDFDMLAECPVDRTHPGHDHARQASKVN